MATALLATAAAPVFESTAQADSGSCAVKERGPSPTYNTPFQSYIVRNKCAAGYDFKVVLDPGGTNSSLGCFPIPAGRYRVWLSYPNQAPNWSAVVC